LRKRRESLVRQTFLLFFVWCIPNGELGVIGEPFGEMRRFEKDMRGMIRWKIPNPGDIAGNA
jgi:hypothetical protein